jgi:hypothetical protein
VPGTERELHPAFVLALQKQRDGLNTRFHLRRQVGARIDGADLLQHLRDVVEPILREVHAVAPDRVAPAVTGLYETSLDLLGASLLGAEPKSPFVNRVWREVLPQMPRLIAHHARDVAGRLSNAVQHVAGQPGARPDEWLARMGRVAHECGSVSHLLDCGRAAAWLSGLVQYRSAGLAALHTLPPGLACRVAGVPLDTSAGAWARACTRLSEDPWLTVKTALAEDRPMFAIELVARAGAFRGFGGPFRRPPTIAAEGGQFLVEDGESEWGLLADAYGVFFHRTGDARRTERRPRPVESAAIDPAGRVRWNGAEAVFPFLASATSTACNGKTVAVTIPTSHHVFLLARPGAAP